MTSRTFFIICFIATIIFIPIFLLLIAHHMFDQLSKRNLDIYQYKITNFPWTTFKVLCYLIVVGILFNLLRLYAAYNLYMNNIQLDIKPFFINIFFLFKNIYNSNIVLFIYFTITALLALFCLLFIWRRIHKYFLNLVFSLHIYMFAFILLCTPKDLHAVRKNAKFAKFFEFYRDEMFYLAFGYGARDIIRQTIGNNIFKIMDVYQYWYGLREDSLETKFLRFMWLLYRLICTKWLIGFDWGGYVFFLSPLIVLFCDCIFNDFVINHAFYWFTLYIMMVQFYRVCNLTRNSVNQMLGLLYDLYYGPAKYTFFIPEELKPFFDTYIWNGCAYIPEMSALKNFEFGELVPSFRFEYIPDLKVYENIEGYRLKKVGENVFMFEDREEKWVNVGGALK